MGRRLPLGALLGVALLSAIGVGGLLWARDGESVGDTARLVPAGAAVYATVNTDAASRQWVQMSQLLARLGVEQSLLEARDSAAGLADLAWDGDIAPFLGGEATLAWTGMEEETPHFLLILATQDGERAWNHAVKSLDERAKAAGVSPGTRSHRGSSIRSYHDDELGGSIWLTRVDRYLVLTNDPEGAVRSLDLAGGRGESLATEPRFRAARAGINADPLLFVYLNPAAASALNPFSGSLLLPLPSADEALRSGGLENAAFAFAATAERQGLRFEWRVNGLDANRNPISLAAAPDQSRFAERTPAEALLYVSGMNLYESYIRGLKESFAGLSGGAGGDDPLAELNATLGVDLENDLLRHLTGEYAFAFGARRFSPDDAWALAMSGVADPAAVSRSMAALVAEEQRQGGRVGRRTVGGATVTEWDAGGTAAAYSVTGNDLLVAVPGGTLDRALAPRQTLAADGEYREAMGLLPGKRSFTMYLSVARALALAESDQSSGLGLLPEGANLARLRYLVVGATQEREQMGGVAFLRIGGE